MDPILPGDSTIIGSCVRNKEMRWWQCWTVVVSGPSPETFKTKEEATKAARPTLYIYITFK